MLMMLPPLTLTYYFAAFSLSPLIFAIFHAMLLMLMLLRLLIIVADAAELLAFSRHAVIFALITLITPCRHYFSLSPLLPFFSAVAQRYAMLMLLRCRR